MAALVSRGLAQLKSKEMRDYLTSTVRNDINALFDHLIYFYSIHMNSIFGDQLLIGPKNDSLCFYSMLFMRFAVQVKPKNRLLFACHFANECAQLVQLARFLNYKYGTPQPMKQYQVPSTASIPKTNTPTSAQLTRPT
ncbi:unnamed protein product [Rotaria sordida]|uniref:Mitochondrial pyruvate carrier n=1 Tax=Rotaria sordida TaxID=392033 RepID=A0A814K0L1_9BILA|nr:unnamed protein product [Rotaria sordida]